ncbi:MAG: hypothetical protein ACK4N5_23765, partial [Myxococcales bacterium]
MDLNRLRREGEGLLGRLERHKHRSAAGFAPEENFASMFRQFGALTSPEAWAVARDWQVRASDTEE